MSAGNLHLVVFELLFKHARNFKSSYAKLTTALLALSVIVQSLSNFKVKCARLMAFEILRMSGQESTSLAEDPTEEAE